MELNNRIQKIIQYSMLTASEFADEIGVQRSNISHIISGRNKPSLDFIVKIKDRFPEIQWEWIIEGKGEMTKSTLSPTSLQESKINFSEKEKNSETDLFSIINPPSYPTTENKSIPNPLELNISAPNIEKEKINDSQTLEEESILSENNNNNNNNNQNSKTKIKKIIILYENGKFEAYEP